VSGPATFAIRPCDQFTTNMERREFLACGIKWLAFIICTIGFAWNTSDSFITYLSQNVGTKIVLKQNYESSLPSFAICRHPNNIVNKTIVQEEFSISNKDLKYLKGYEATEAMNMTMLDVFKLALVNESSSIERISVLSHGQYAGASLPSLISNPDRNPQNWHASFHPVFGVCQHFTFQEDIEDCVGKAGIEFAKINIDFEKAFDHPIIKSDQMSGFMTIDNLIVAEEMNSEEPIEEDNANRGFPIKFRCWGPIKNFFYNRRNGMSSFVDLGRFFKTA
jgi:hypothetical protein